MSSAYTPDDIKEGGSLHTLEAILTEAETHADECYATLLRVDELIIGARPSEACELPPAVEPASFPLQERLERLTRALHKNSKAAQLIKSYLV